MPAIALDVPAAAPSIPDATAPSMVSGPHPAVPAPPKPAVRSTFVLALLTLAGAIFAVALVGFLYLQYQESRAGRSRTPGLAEPDKR